MVDEVRDVMLWFPYMADRKPRLSDESWVGVV